MKAKPQQKSRNLKPQCNTKWFTRIVPTTSTSALTPKQERLLASASATKPCTKRLRHTAKGVNPKKQAEHHNQRTTDSHQHQHHHDHHQPLTNGGGASSRPPDSESEDSRDGMDDSQDWGSFAQRSVPQNGLETLACPEESAGPARRTAPGRLDEETLHYCAQRDHVHNRTALVMQPGQTLCFRGKCRLTCVYGRVEVLGFTIEEGQQSYPLFSPSSHCPLTVTALGDSSHPSKHTKEGRVEAKAMVRKYLSTELWERVLNTVDSDSCVILLEPLDTPLTRFLASVPELIELFELSYKDLQDASAMLETPLNSMGVVPLRSTTQSLVMSQSYRDALNSLITACSEELDGCPVILVCGPKNAGKSTFNRLLINTLLNHTTSVEYLECDPGQTELTPPGCLSLSTITEPLLGPPFTHQRTPDHMIFYGEPSCERELDRYLDTLKTLWRSYHREMPIIINTMGWVKGFGFQLLVDMIRFFSVSHVVQLGYGANNQCPALTPDFLRTCHGWQTRPPAQSALGEDSRSLGALHTYTHLTVLSEHETAGTAVAARYQRSNEQRDLAILAYLSGLQSPEPGPVQPLHSFTPFQVPHSALAVGVTHCEVEPKHIFYAANASLVALCCLGETVSGTTQGETVSGTTQSSTGPVLLSQTPVCPCVGFGVVRGVDMARGLYAIITPVAPSVLRQVNCLLLGSVTLPQSILMEQPGVEGDVAYLTTDYSLELHGSGKLKFYKGLVRPGQQKQ